MLSDGTSVDEHCQEYYDDATCRRFGAFQALNFTLLDAMGSLGFDVYLYGKVDVGAGIIEMPSQSNSTADGFHNGPSIVITTRSANIDRATKPNPLNMTNDHDNNVHHEDTIIVENCQERIASLAQRQEADKPWFLYCSVNIPHPPFDTNETWLQQVDVDAVPLPYWQPEDEM